MHGKYQYDDGKQFPIYCIAYKSDICYPYFSFASNREHIIRIEKGIL